MNFHNFCLHSIVYKTFIYQFLWALRVLPCDFLRNLFESIVTNCLYNCVVDWFCLQFHMELLLFSLLLYVVATVFLYYFLMWLFCFYWKKKSVVAVFLGFLYGVVTVTHNFLCIIVFLFQFEAQTSFGSIYKTRIEGNSMFCDYYNPQQKTYCKRLKVLCPEHTKERKVIHFMTFITRSHCIARATLNHCWWWKNPADFSHAFGE